MHREIKDEQARFTGPSVPPNRAYSSWASRDGAVVKSGREGVAQGGLKSRGVRRKKWGRGREISFENSGRDGARKISFENWV